MLFLLLGLIHNYFMHCSEDSSIYLRKYKNSVRDFPSVTLALLGKFNFSLAILDLNN